LRFLTTLVNRKFQELRQNEGKRYRSNTEGGYFTAFCATYFGISYKKENSNPILMLTYANSVTPKSLKNYNL
jgi:hypothetical protein